MNILLCIRKQLDSTQRLAGLGFLGVGRNDPTMERFRHRLSQLFPTSRHAFAAHDYRFVDMQRGLSIGFIASPPHAHEAGLRWMFEHGVDRIVLEKPIASSTCDVDAIGDVLRDEPDRVCVQEQYLYSRLYEELLQLVANPVAYVAARCGRAAEALTVTGTLTRFYKGRLKDLGHQRHVENICLLELPHILTLLHNAFGQQTVASLDVDDLHYRSRVYPRYKRASIVLHDRAGRRHDVDLSNVDPCRRTMSIALSDGTSVELAFPGRLRGDVTIFESRVTISRGRRLLFLQSYADDHLSTAVRRYLRWDGILGTYERCFEPSRLAADLAGR